MAQDPTVSTEAPRVFCVSPRGSDSNVGTVASPFLTLDHARLAVEPYEKGMTGNIVILLRGGTYMLPSPLVFSAADSGRNGHAVIWQNYPGERPVISGGRVITGWTVDTGRKVKAATPPLLMRQLFVNGIRCARTRSVSVPGETSVKAGGYTWGDLSLAAYARPSDLEVVQRSEWWEMRCPVASVRGTTVTMQTPGWTNCEGSGHPLRIPSWVENAYELLTTAGQFYYNMGTSTLYYIPRVWEKMPSATVVAPLLENLVTIAGTAGSPVSHLTFQGLSFQYTTWLRPSTSAGYPSLQAGTFYDASRSSLSITNSVLPRAAVEVSYASDITLTRCIFTRLGGAGVALLDGAQSCTLKGCVLTDISSGGVLIGDPDKPRPSVMDMLSHDTVTDNLVHDCGVEYHDAVGICAWYADHLTLSHNTIYNLPYTGLSLGWGWTIPETQPNANATNVVQANLIHDVVQTLNDGGGLYSNGAQPGEIVAENVIYNIPTMNSGPGGSYNSGLYFDDGSQGGTAQNNVVYRTGSYNVHANNNTAPLLLRDNTFDIGSVVTTTNAIAPTQIGNATAPPSSNPSVVSAAGLEPAFKDLLTLTP